MAGCGEAYGHLESIYDYGRDQRHVGHDADLDALAELFGLSWHALPFPANSTTPGSALRLDLTNDGKSVRASIVYQQFDSSNPPMRTVSATWTKFDSSTVSLEELQKWMTDRYVDECIPAEK